jgi:hypothetical protein
MILTDSNTTANPPDAIGKEPAHGFLLLFSKGQSGTACGDLSKALNAAVQALENGLEQRIRRLDSICESICSERKVGPANQMRKKLMAIHKRLLFSAHSFNYWKLTVPDLNFRKSCEKPVAESNHTILKRNFFNKMVSHQRFEK